MMVFSSWTSMVTYIFLLHKFGVQIYPFKLDKLKKNSAKGKKIWLKNVHKARYLMMQNIT